jgi:hypothetical protein
LDVYDVVSVFKCLHLLLFNGSFSSQRHGMKDIHVITHLYFSRINKLARSLGLLYLRGRLGVK